MQIKWLIVETSVYVAVRGVPLNTRLNARCMIPSQVALKGNYRIRFLLHTNVVGLCYRFNIINDK